MLAMYIAEARGSMKEFWQLTPKQFFLIMQKLRHMNEMSDRAEWERARWTVYINLLPHMGKNKKLTLHDVTRFPWEEVSEKIQKKEEIQALIERISKRDKIDVSITVDGEKLKADGTNSGT